MSNSNAEQPWWANWLGAIAVNTWDAGTSAISRAYPILVVLVLFAAVIIGVKDLRPHVPPPPTVLVLPARAEGSEPMTLPATLFDFNQATLNDAGRAEFERLAARIKDVPNQDGLVLGHTDRFGTKDSNARLAYQRAQTIQHELEAKHLLKRVWAIPVGSALPVTRPKECPGETPEKRVIDCLAKDRRVEIWLRPHVD